MFGYRYYEPVTMEEWLYNFTVNDLKQWIRLLNLPIRKSGRKAELVEALSRAFLTPEIMVEHMSYYEIELVRHIVNNPDHTIDVLTQLFNPDCLVANIGILQIENVDETTRRYHLIREFSDAWRSYFAYGYDESKLVKRYTIQRLLTGYANICGSINFSSALNLLDVKDSALYGIDPMDLLHEYYVQRINGNPRAYEYPYDERLFAPFSIPEGEKIGEAPKAEFLSQFSREDVLAAAQMPNPQVGIWLPQYREFRKYLLEKEKLSEEKTDKILSVIWKAKHIGLSMSGLASMLFDEYNVHNINKFIICLQKYLNFVPYWKFSGVSSEEIFRTREQPRLRPLPEDPFEFISTKPFTNSSPKIGRNGPCPCGSGKKYKHCCGRN